MTNTALRRHVTRVGFQLTLGKTHIAAIVWLDALLTRQGDWTLEDDRRFKPGSLGYDMDRTDRDFSLFVPGCRGLIDRGLVVRPHGHDVTRSMANSQIWEITDAGRFTIGLLKESGIWADYASALPAPVETAVAA